MIIGEGVTIGSLEELKDNFGHTKFSSSGNTTEQLLTNYLNGIDNQDGKTRLIVRGNARCEKPGTRQRREFSYVSEVDLAEAYEVGKHAVEIALAGENGYMSTIVRTPGKDYTVLYEKVPLNIVANSEREFPKNWVTEDKIDVTDDFIQWAMPLIGKGLPTFCKFSEIYTEKKCSTYIPVAYR